MTKSQIHANFGFRSIQKKSVQYDNSRFRDQLIHLAVLCRENAIDSFVQNLDDMNILLSSMSSSCILLLDHAYQKSRFTESVKNIDWRFGEEQIVIGKNSSVYSEKEANKEVRNAQRSCLGDGTIQNRLG